MPVGSQETALTQQERRQSRRSEIAQPIRVQPKDLKDGYFDELTVTVNTSRNGIAFASRLAVYYIGMELRVTYPYTATVKINHVGRVIRIEPLDSNFQRIILKLT